MAGNKTNGNASLSPAKLEAVLFYVNANREPMAMQVWLASGLDKAAPVTLADPLNQPLATSTAFVPP